MLAICTYFNYTKNIFWEELDFEWDINWSSVKNGTHYDFAFPMVFFPFGLVSYPLINGIRTSNPPLLIPKSILHSQHAAFAMLLICSLLTFLVTCSHSSVAMLSFIGVNPSPHLWADPLPLFVFVPSLSLSRVAETSITTILEFEEAWRYCGMGNY